MSLLHPAPFSYPLFYPPIPLAFCCFIPLSPSQVALTAVSSALALTATIMDDQQVHGLSMGAGCENWV